MEKIKLDKSDDLVFGIFGSSPSEVLKKILVVNIFSNSKKMYLVKFATIEKVLDHLWMATFGDSHDKICFSIITDHLNPIGCSFEKIRSQKTSLTKKKIWLSMKCNVFEKTIRLTWQKTFILICQGSTMGGNQITNEVSSPRKLYHKIRIWSTNVQTRYTWKTWLANPRNF